MLLLTKEVAVGWFSVLGCVDSVPKEGGRSWLVGSVRWVVWMQRGHDRLVG